MERSSASTSDLTHSSPFPRQAIRSAPVSSHRPLSGNCTSLLPCQAAARACLPISACPGTTADRKLHNNVRTMFCGHLSWAAAHAIVPGRRGLGARPQPTMVSVNRLQTRPRRRIRPGDRGQIRAGVSIAGGARALIGARRRNGLRAKWIDIPPTARTRLRRLDRCDARGTGCCSSAALATPHGARPASWPDWRVSGTSRGQSAGVIRSKPPGLPHPWRRSSLDAGNVVADTRADARAIVPAPWPACADAGSCEDAGIGDRARKTAETGPVLSVSNLRARKGPRNAGLCAARGEIRKFTECVAGAGGFEPPYGGIKIRCLTAWLRPNAPQGGYRPGGKRPDNSSRSCPSQWLPAQFCLRGVAEARRGQPQLLRAPPDRRCCRRRECRRARLVPADRRRLQWRRMPPRRPARR
jgi:hypothetical protein